MEKILENAIVQAPGLVVLVVLVWVFLKHISERDKSYLNAMKDLHHEHIAAREQSQAVVKENTEVLQHNTIAVNNLSSIVSRIKNGGKGV